MMIFYLKPKAAEDDHAHDLTLHFDIKVNDMHYVMHMDKGILECGHDSFVFFLLLFLFS